MQSSPNWRIRPSAADAYAIIQIARCEGRSVSNVLIILIREALQARQRADKAISSLVEMIRGAVEPPQ
jgi:hypothetical protein